jgi:hypothetical protein
MRIWVGCGGEVENDYEVLNGTGLLMDSNQK